MCDAWSSSHQRILFTVVCSNLLDCSVNCCYALTSVYKDWRGFSVCCAEFHQKKPEHKKRKSKWHVRVFLFCGDLGLCLNSVLNYCMSCTVFFCWLMVCYCPHCFLFALCLWYRLEPPSLCYIWDWNCLLHWTDFTYLVDVVTLRCYASKGCVRSILVNWKKKNSNSICTFL